MRQLFVKPVMKIVLPVIVVIAAGFGLLAVETAKSGAQTAESATAAQPLVAATVLNVTCTSVGAFSNTYAKITDIGTFTVQGPDSLVDVTFNGRISVGSLTSSNGAIFELRVDNLATTQGRARAVFRNGESTGNGAPVSIKGIFTGLSAGAHTVSIWVQAGGTGSGTGGRIDPGCWSSDHVVVTEYKPWWGSFMAAIMQNRNPGT